MMLTRLNLEIYNEKKQTQIVRLKSVKDSFEVAEVFFDNTQKMLSPPSDTE